MGCFSACFGTIKHKIAIKKCHCNNSPLQEQSLSPRHEIHEAIKLLAAATKSVKEEEIINPMKLNSESQFGNESSNENDQTENKKEKGQDESSNSISSSLNIPHPENRGDEGFTVCDKICIGECCLVQEESSESLFSLSIDSRRQQVCAVEMGDNKEVSSPLKNSDKEANSRIVENEHHSQLKDKENINLEGKLIIPFSKEEPNIKEKYQTKCDNEIAVDTSLSSWLVETKRSSHKNSIDNSPESEKNYGDRRILGEISPQEHKQLNEEFPSANSTPCSVDDQPGIGTVGSYWRQSRVRANLAKGF
ncbi:hypothetical protein ACJIZ3_008798 [Penstemon smallii]|uniref:Uncharacterized protein n=1 Tax=Penstemon smallii TaxID=265156 RepID=A0ABD3TAS7_9LAMI